MARRDDRLLSTEEQQLVAQTRHPRIKQLKGDELLDIIQQLRQSRNRARGRRKATSSRTSAFATSVTPVPEIEESAGHRAKRTLLSAALKRANKETSRRISEGARSKPA